MDIRSDLDCLTKRELMQRVLHLERSVQKLETKCDAMSYGEYVRDKTIKTYQKAYEFLMPKFTSRASRRNQEMTEIDKKMKHWTNLLNQYKKSQEKSVVILADQSEVLDMLATGKKKPRRQKSTFRNKKSFVIPGAPPTPSTSSCNSPHSFDDTVFISNEQSFSIAADVEIDNSEEVAVKETFDCYELNTGSFSDPSYFARNIPLLCEESYEQTLINDNLSEVYSYSSYENDLTNAPLDNSRNHKEKVKTVFRCAKEDCFQEFEDYLTFSCHVFEHNLCDVV